MDVIKELEKLRDEFDYELSEASNPGTGLDPYVYGTYEGKAEAYEEAKFAIQTLINKLKGN